MDWVLDRLTNQAIHGATLGTEAFTDFDYADDVAFLSELLCLLLSALEMFAEEAAPVGLAVNWKESKIQFLSDFLPPMQDLRVSGDQIEAVTFTNSAPRSTYRVAANLKSKEELVWPELPCGISTARVALQTKVRLYDI